MYSTIIEEIDFKQPDHKNSTGSFKVWGTCNGVAFSKEYDSNDLDSLLYSLYVGGKYEPSTDMAADFFAFKYYSEHTTYRLIGLWIDDEERRVAKQATPTRVIPLVNEYNPERYYGDLTMYMRGM